MLGTDLSPFFHSAHFAQAVVWKGVSGLGIYDAPGTFFHGNDVMTTDHTVTVKSSEFGKAVYGDPITVGGTAYQVREVRPLDDGAICEISLLKV